MAKEPRAATMAPLSVQREAGGIRTLTLALSHLCLASSRSRELAATPPAITKLSIPESLQANNDLLIKTSTIAS
jgi:hypothetical protein